MQLRKRVTQHLPAPGSNRGYEPEIFVRSLVTLFMLGGVTLSDLRELEREKALLGLLGADTIPDEDTIGQWFRRMGDPEKKQAGLMGLGSGEAGAGPVPSDRRAHGLLPVLGRGNEFRAGMEHLPSPRMASAERRLREFFQGAEKRCGSGLSAHRGPSRQRGLLPDRCSGL